MSQLNVSRIDWVDYSKGVCIILVVLMHTTLGVEKLTGINSWLHSFIDWAKPFRMPDFFLISGLFLSARINRPWREYIDAKVMHFAYFYVLWMIIQVFLKSAHLVQNGDWVGLFENFAVGLVEPYGTLWFIYLLAAFFITTKLAQQIPAAVVFLLALALEIAPIATGWTFVDEFASRYVFFFTGFWLANFVFSFAEKVRPLKITAMIGGLIVWAYFNFLFVHHQFSEVPFVSFALGIIGSLAVVTLGVVLSKIKGVDFIRYCGTNSIIIYLAFPLFMASARSLTLNVLPFIDRGLASLMITAISVLGPILLYLLTSGTQLHFLFHRANWARLAKDKKQWHSASHVAKLNYKIR